MFNHEPQDYDCPFCSFLAGNPDQYKRPEDTIYQVADNPLNDMAH